MAAGRGAARCMLQALPMAGRLACLDRPCERARLCGLTAQPTFPASPCDWPGSPRPHQRLTTRGAADPRPEHVPSSHKSQQVKQELLNILCMFSIFFFNLHSPSLLLSHV